MASSVENIIKMIRILQNESCVSGQELAYRLGVSVKTIQKYKQDLDQMHIFIETKKGRYGGYYIDQTVLELHSALSEVELKGPIEAKQHLMEDRHFRFKTEAVGAIDKVLQNERLAAAVKNKNSIAKLDNASFRGGFERIKLEKIQAAIKESAIIYIEFESDQTGRVDCLVHPYGLIQFDGKFILLAFCEIIGAIRLFQVECIRHLAVTKHQFVPPETVESLWAKAVKSDADDNK